MSMWYIYQNQKRYFHKQQEKLKLYTWYKIEIF